MQFLKKTWRKVEEVVPFGFFLVSSVECRVVDYFLNSDYYRECKGGKLWECMF